MAKKKNRKRKGACARCAQISRVLGTFCLLAVILICLPLTVPRVFGYEIYTVISGSMEPAIMTGSLVYVERGEPEDAKVDDVIAFYSSMDTGAIITHRVIDNDIVTGEIYTKGDANEKEDLYPVLYSNYMGKVVCSIPVLGEVLAFVVTLEGKMAAAGMIFAALLLHGIGGILDGIQEKRKEVEENETSRY